MPSIKTIAAELGVSHSLVSKVLNNRLGTTGVSEKMKLAIQAKAEELDYVPNRLAVALKRGRKDAFGVFFHQLGSPGSDVSDRLLTGIADAMDAKGLRMWLRFCKTSEEILKACDDRLHTEVDGLIVAGVSHPEIFPKLRSVVQRKVATVTVFPDATGSAGRGLTNVRTDYDLHGYLPTLHLIETGSKRLVNLRTNAMRNSGFDRACQETGFPEKNIIRAAVASFAYEDGTKATRLLLDKGEKFDGVVCQSDAQACGVVNELFKAGIEVPRQVRVTGVDNSPLAKHCIVPLTSVTSEMRLAGTTAVECVLKTLDGGRPPHELVLAPRLVPSTSTEVSAR
jgi:LacI family transcriptional regulator